jgi:hypothetical protein
VLRNIMMLCAILCGLAMPSAVASEGEDTPPAPEMVGNPAYQSWAEFAPGTFVRYSTTYEPVPTAEGFSVESTTTYTLKAVTEDKVEIAVSTIATLASGKSVTRTPSSVEYPAQIEKPAETPKPVEEGEETIEVGDQEIATAWTKTVATEGTTTVTTTVWTSDAVPGGTVKCVIERKDAKATTTETKTVVDYKVVEPEPVDDIEPVDEIEPMDE